LRFIADQQRICFIRECDRTNHFECRQQLSQLSQRPFEHLRELKISSSSLKPIPPLMHMLPNLAHLSITVHGSSLSCGVFSHLAAMRHLRQLVLNDQSREQAIQRSDMRLLHGLNLLSELALGAWTGADIDDTDVVDLLRALPGLRSVSLQFGLWSQSPNTLRNMGSLVPQLRRLTLMKPREVEPWLGAFTQGQAFPSLEHLTVGIPLWPNRSAFYE
jgi:hypothetical protein